MAEFAGEGALVEPVHPVRVVADHQLVVVVLEADAVRLGEVLVDGEVVAEDADAADLAGVPGPRHQRAPVHSVVLRHLQPVAALNVEADLVLRYQFNICSHHVRCAGFQPSKKFFKLKHTTGNCLLL